MPPARSSARFFKTAADFRAWLLDNHAKSPELQIGFYKKNSGKTGMTYQEAVDEALCFGWIDGLLHGIDGESFMLRFTPRRPRSNWSNVNVAHIARLTAAGRMHPAGLQAFEARTAARTGVYRYEQAEPPPTFDAFPADLEKVFKKAKSAWAFWKLQPPGYRRKLTTWAATAKQATTRLARLQRIIAASAAGQRLN